MQLRYVGDLDLNRLRSELSMMEATDYVSLPRKVWEDIRDEIVTYQEIPFKADPNWPCPNYVVSGVPIIAAGRA